MKRRFEIYTAELGDRITVPVGFSPVAAAGSWAWAFAKRLWVEAAALLAVNAVAFGVLYANRLPAAFYIAFQVLFGIFVGSNARRLRELAAERAGFGYTCTVPARDAATAIAMLAQVGGEPLPEWRPRSGGGVPDFTPKPLRGWFAITLLTLKAAFRYRLVVVLLALLVAVVFALPGIIKHDGTATGFSQILLAYTLTAITALLGFSTLWLACGTLARDIEEMQLFLVVVKPVPRWQVWLGKWTGIMVLNAGMVALAGTIVYGLLQVRSHQLSPEQYRKLKEEVLVARESRQPPPINIDAEVEKVYQQRKSDPTIASLDPAFVRKQVRAQLAGRLQVVPPGEYRPLPFFVDLGPGARERYKDRPLFVRVRFISPEYAGSDASFNHGWEIGGTKTRKPERFSNSFGPDTPTEFPISPDGIEEDGRLVIRYANLSKLPVVFTTEQGIEVLIPEASFAVNYARGLAIIVCWLALLAAVGLFAASFLSFPVAAFVSLALLVVGLSGGTLKQVVEQGGIVDVEAESGLAKQGSAVNAVAVQIYGGAYWVLSQISGFSPVDSLASGHSITWSELARAFLMVVGVAGGSLGAAGIAILNRRELALPT
ncbi:MAG: DUF2628 domain-containing protein [Verrucomicrobia bacterium]|nr:MAG: DUF2628 domain-containing protein [Verrucomicrobiota bacterium]